MKTYTAETINNMRGVLLKVASLKLPRLSSADWDDIWQNVLIEIWQKPRAEWTYGLVLTCLIRRGVDFVRHEHKKGFTQVPENAPEFVTLESQLNTDSGKSTEHDAWVSELKDMFNKIPAP